MEYWTFLVITLSAPFDDYVSTLPYRNLEECWKAHPQVEATLSLSVDTVQCMETTVPSASIRPKPRPQGLNTEGATE